MFHAEEGIEKEESQHERRNQKERKRER